MRCIGGWKGGELAIEYSAVAVFLGGRSLAMPAGRERIWFVSNPDFAVGKMHFLQAKVLKPENCLVHLDGRLIEERQEEKLEIILCFQVSHFYFHVILLRFAV